MLLNKIIEIICIFTHMCHYSSLGSVLLSPLVPFLLLLVSLFLTNSSLLFSYSSDDVTGFAGRAGWCLTTESKVFYSQCQSVTVLYGHPTYTLAVHGCVPPFRSSASTQVSHSSHAGNALSTGRAVLKLWHPNTTSCSMTPPTNTVVQLRGDLWSSN